MDDHDADTEPATVIIIQAHGLCPRCTAALYEWLGKAMRKDIDAGHVAMQLLAVGIATIDAPPAPTPEERKRGH